MTKALSKNISQIVLAPFVLTLAQLAASATQGRLRRRLDPHRPAMGPRHTERRNVGRRLYNDHE